MRARTYAVASLLGILPVIGFISCTSEPMPASNDQTGAGGGDTTTEYWETGGAAGQYGTTTSTQTTTTEGTTWGEGGAGGSGTGGTGGAGGDGGQDAGADAAGACDGLDMSQPVVLYLSSDDSNSMASPVRARERLNSNKAPNGIRTYEFLNYYRIAFAPPVNGPIGLFAEAEQEADPAELMLQLGVRSFDAVKPRRPMTITFVLDTSGSMAGPAIERERAAVKAIAASLAKNDVISMVTWNTDNLVVLDGHVANGPNDPAVLNAADNLLANGGTDLHAGLVKGYDIAQTHYGVTRLNRVVLISDGGANVGITDENLIAANSLDADNEGIYLVGIGAGPAGNYNDLLMDTVTDKGRGAYVYLDTPSEATAMFVNRFDETMEVAARGVQVELTMPWYFRIKDFFGEEFSANPDEIEPQHLAPSDAMVIQQTIKACDAAVINPMDPVKVHVTWEEPLTYTKLETTLETTVGDLMAADKPHITKGRAIIAYAEALKMPTSENLQYALARVQAANSSGTDPELTEIAALIPKHPNF